MATEDNEDVWREFGEWIRTIREDAGVTTRAAARHAGIHEGSWSRIESGNMGVKRATAVRIAEALRINPNEALAKAGFAPLANFPDPSPEPAPEPEVDSSAFTAFFEGLPPTLQRAEYERLKAVWRQHRSGKLPEPSEKSED